MKAGRAGSNPEGAAKSAKATQPLRCFLREVGEAVTNLNTTVVGLDAVENHYEKPAGLNISWNPKDRMAAARKARRFVLESVLVRVNEALLQYIITIEKLPRFNILRESWSKNSLSKAEKLADIAGETIGSDCYLTAGACLLVHWRNRVVHRKSVAKLTLSQTKTLKQSGREIETKYASLSVDRLLLDFEAGRPTLKDISSLIAMTIRLVHNLDIKIKDLSLEDLDAMLDHYGLFEQIKKLKAETSPKKRAASIIRLLETTAPGLANSYEKYYGG